MINYLKKSNIITDLQSNEIYAFKGGGVMHNGTRYERQGIAIIIKIIKYNTHC